MESKRSVKRVRPLAPYIGGKHRLAERLAQRIEAIPHATYAEPFVGMAGVFFRRQTVPKAEIINDANRDVATLFRVLQRHYVPFMEMLRYQLTTRTEFQRLSATDPATLTDLERAARFLYLQRTAFGGKVAKQSFGVTADQPARFDLTKLVPMLEDIHERLARVVIECLPYEDFIRRYDRPGTLFYLDPPYWGCESDYGKGLFGRDDFERLAELLAGIEGRFLLSLNDIPEIRTCFRGFTVEAVKTSYTLPGADKRRVAGELIISNRRKRRRPGP